MSTNRLNVLVAVLSVLVFLVAEFGHAQTDIFRYQKRPQNAVAKYCGINLSTALHLVCNGKYNQLFKKSGQEIETRDYGYVGQLTPERANTMFNRFAGRFRRESRGVYDECCVKACTTNELRSYCLE